MGCASQFRTVLSQALSCRRKSGLPCRQRTSDQQRPYDQLGCAAAGSGPGGFTRRGRGRGQSRSPAPGSGQKPSVRPDSAPSLAPTAAARPTHLATASTEPRIGAPPSSPPSYSTPEMSSSTPRTPASRLPHAAIALRCAPQTPHPNPRLGTAGGLAAQGRLGSVVLGCAVRRGGAGPVGWAGCKPGTARCGTRTPDAASPFPGHTPTKWEPAPQVGKSQEKQKTSRWEIVNLPKNQSKANQDKEAPVKVANVKEIIGVLILLLGL